MAGKDYSGAFTKWAGRKMPPDVRNFANWAYSEATSHPIERLSTTLKTGKLPPVQDKELFPAPSDSESAPASRPPSTGRMPEMLKSRYWRPGAGGNR